MKGITGEKQKQNRNGENKTKKEGNKQYAREQRMQNNERNKKEIKKCVTSRRKGGPTNLAIN
jgi:hypothetical protein